MWTAQEHAINTVTPRTFTISIVNVIRHVQMEVLWPKIRYIVTHVLKNAQLVLVLLLIVLNAPKSFIIKVFVLMHAQQVIT